MTVLDYMNRLVFVLYVIQRCGNMTEIREKSTKKDVSTNAGENQEDNYAYNGENKKKEPTCEHGYPAGDTPCLECIPDPRNDGDESWSTW